MDKKEMLEHARKAYLEAQQRFYLSRGKLSAAKIESKEAKRAYQHAVKRLLDVICIKDEQ